MSLVSGYDPIQAFSTVTIYLEQIATLDINSNSRIKIQVMSSYSGDPSIYIFYNSWEVFVPTTPTAFNILNANAALTIVRTGSIVLMERSDYNFTFFVTNALTANRDYIVIEFPTNGYLLNTDYSDVRVSISDPIKTSQRYIFNWKNVIYIYPTQAITFGSVTVTVSNLPNPAYLFNSTQTYRVETIVFNKTTETYVNTMSLDTAFCALFSNIQVDYPSLFTLINENTYTFSFKVDHVIPGTGSIAIIFDPNLYVLRPSSPTCQLVSGLPSTATCVRELFSQQMMRISLNGGAIAKGTSMVVKIINVNNPTVANQAPTFTITSFYDNVQASNNIICSSTVTTTAFNAYSQITCPLSIEPGAVNAGAETEYEVTLNCADNIRNATTLKITLPTNIQGFTSNFGCTTNGNYMLSPCTNTARTSEVVLTVLKPNIQKPLIVRIKGVLQPSIIGQVPTMNVNLEQYGIQYGNTDTANSLLTFTVVSNLNQRTYTNNAKINVFPANYGERGMYFFDVGSLTFNTEPSSFRLIFDTNFNKVVGTDLECGTFTPASAYQGASFAMNYEVMANWVLFTCTVIDDYVINVQYPSTITFKDKPNSDFNFYVEGITNPASGTSFTFKFNFYDSNKAIVLISSTTVTLQFDPPPSMLRLSSVSSTDNNVLSVNNYTFVINTTYSLPFSVTTGNKDYELVVKFPAAQYPSFTNYRTPISYSFSRQSLNTGSAFNFKNSIYFYANYPDLSLISPLSLTMSNITNPSSRTDCSFGSTTSLSFEVQYVSRTMGKIYAKTYPAMDQSNCLTLTKTRYSIEASTSYLMVRGLSYPLTINVEQAATGLRLVPYSRYLIFSPTEVNFTNFLTSTATINIIVPADLPVGEYVIRWQKYETNNPPRYLDVPDTKVSIAPSTVLAPLAIVSIETFNYVWTGSLARDVMVTLSQDPASEVIVTINLRNADSKVQSSLDNVVFSDFPVSLRFVRGETRKRFYIWAEAGASSNYLTITLSGANSDVYNPNIQEYPFMIMTPLASGSISVVNSQILNIYENSATARISISSIGTIYYAAIIKSGSHVPQVSELLNSKFKDMDKKWYNAGAVSVEALGDGNSYSVTFNLTGLYSQTSYSLFCIARSTSGQYSNISNVTFTTLKVSPGASIRIPTSASIDTSVLGVALSNILSIPASRIIFKSAQVFTDTAQSQITGTTYNTYTFIIAPDPTNNSPSAIELANEITGGAAAVNLKSLVPTFYSNLGVKVAQVVHIPPKVLSSPKIIDVGYYTLSITMELIEEGKGYALVTENNTVGNTKPTSYQIAHGLLADNSQAENRYWIAAPSDVNGFVQITFDELKDNTYYNIYITAANNIPYEPADLLDDSSVIVLSTTTLENPSKKFLFLLIL